MAQHYDKYKLRPQEPIYIAMEGFDLSFYQHEIWYITLAWQGGTPLMEMAARIKRKPEEVTVLIIDLAYHGKIEQRAGGIFGKAQ